MGLWRETPLGINYPKAGFGSRMENRPCKSTSFPPLCPRYCQVILLPTAQKGSRQAEGREVNQNALA